MPLEGELTLSSGLQPAHAGVQWCAGLHPHCKQHPGKACGRQPAPNTSACSAATPSSAAQGSTTHPAHTVTLSAEDSRENGGESTWGSTTATTTFPGPPAVWNNWFF